MSNRIRRAVISVSDKSGLVDFAKGLSEMGVELISTGGTMKTLKNEGIAVKSVTEITGFPEIMDGRVKTLHPAIFSGILARRSMDKDLETLKEQNLPLIDLIVVNLYPFEKVSSNPDAVFEDVIENIDIGGPSMLRAAAKNFNDVAVVCSADQYPDILDELKENDCALSIKTKKTLARKVFENTAAYDACIVNYLLSKEEDAPAFSDKLTISYNKISGLRYGENPHQKAAYYAESGSSETSIPRAKLLHGKPLSYNNIADLDTALDCIRDFEETAVIILKHANPCGLAVSESQVEAYRLARACDPVSFFGGIVGLNRECDAETAKEINSSFIECVIAPSFSGEAFEILSKKKNIRLLETGDFTPKTETAFIRSIVGGSLIQDRDLGKVKPEDLKVVSKVQPSEDDIKGLLFAWKVVKWVKSNAIVYTTQNGSIGIGAGQMSRVDAAELGVKKAKSPLENVYMASDAFFPFRDSIDAAAGAGVKAIIEPGGSIRDKEVIEAADEHGLILVFTGMRHFRH
jgi:phosphoribosylaminoimidazolecarboxamide formyltransferase / IMP cyclohydrolase